MVRQQDHFGIMRDIQKAFWRYTDIRMYLMWLDEEAIVTLVREGANEEDFPVIVIPKKAGTVDEEIFKSTVEYLEDLLKRNAA